jgi:hypothetical protein
MDNNGTSALLVAPCLRSDRDSNNAREGSYNSILTQSNAPCLRDKNDDGSNGTGNGALALLVVHLACVAMMAATVHERVAMMAPWHCWSSTSDGMMTTTVAAHEKFSNNGALTPLIAPCLRIDCNGVGAQEGSNDGTSA